LGEDVKLIVDSLLIAGVLVSQPQWAHAQDTRLIQAYLSEIVNQARATYKVPAIAVAVMNAEAVYLQEVQGVRVFDKPSPATLDDYFHIGSCSKSVLAMMAAKLVEQKKIMWQTRFFDVFPELKANADNAYSDITLEDLFLSEAGMKAYTNSEAEPFPVYGPSVSDKRLEFIKYLVGLPPSSEKKNGRFQHLYSNASYTMASAMLERVSGLTYEDLVRKTLTDDLGMSVYIGWPNSISSDQPWGHMITNGKVEAFSPDNDYKIPYLIAPAGDLSMTPKDYAKYTQLNLQGLRGNSNYISSEAYRHIHFGHEGFSLGVANGTMGGKRYSGFDGSAGTFFCRSIVVPESDFAFTIMMNAGSGSGSMEAVDWLTMRIVKKRFNWWWKFWL
jgi:CubicO group peptidase (beta-lactamase class C family)